MRTFFCETIPEAGAECLLPPAESQHACRVLRLGEGDALDIVDGAGGRAVAELVRFAGRRRAPEAVVRIGQRGADSPARPRCTLFLAPPRARQMSDCIRMSTEFGVASIVPVICDYSVARPDAGACSHWRAEAIAALKQSGNSFLPEIGEPVPFGEALAALSGLSFRGAPEAAGGVLPDVGQAADVSLWIGPEGGFSDAENAALGAAGVIPVRVGRWILRVETAVPALIGWLFGKGILR